jgi:hypothetical protein
VIKLLDVAMFAPCAEENAMRIIIKATQIEYICVKGVTKYKDLVEIDIEQIIMLSPLVATNLMMMIWYIGRMKIANGVLLRV